jgi:hypothetical protein
MANAAIDHMLSLVIFMAALMIFIALFSQTIQSGLSYQEHSALSTKTSDLLDTILLNPGLPDNWSQYDNTPAGFGLQNPEFTQYKLSSLAAMRLAPSQTTVYHQENGKYYNNISSGFGGYLLTPNTATLNYSNTARLLGISGTYGFQLTLTPTVNVQIQKTSTSGALGLLVTAAGTGYPLATTPITYNLIVVNQGSPYPSYSTITGNTVTDVAGNKQLTFPSVNGETQAYAVIVYAYLDGLKGMGYYVHQPTAFTKSVLPLVDSFQQRRILLAHGDSLGQATATASQLSYNASFVILTEEYTLRYVNLNQANSTGTVFYNSGTSQDYAVTVPDNDGLLIVAYKGTGVGEYGLVLMPWGLESTAFPIELGNYPTGHDWITTDLRQVTIGSIAYQAKLSLWEERMR